MYNNFMFPNQGATMAQNPNTISGCIENLLNNMGVQTNLPFSNNLRRLIEQMLAENGQINQPYGMQSFPPQQFQNNQIQENINKIFYPDSNEDPFRGEDLNNRFTIKFLITSGLSFKFFVPLSCPVKKFLKEFLKCFHAENDQKIVFIYNAFPLNLDEEKSIAEIGIKNNSSIVVHDPSNVIGKNMQINNSQAEQQIINREKLRRFRDKEKAKENEKLKEGNYVLSEENRRIRDMCLLSLIHKQDIEMSEIFEPNKYMKLEEGLNNNESFMVSLLGLYLQKEGCKIAIEKPTSNQNEFSDQLISTILQFLINGFMGYKKHLISIEGVDLSSEEKKNNYLLLFNQHLSKALNLNEDKIITTFPANQNSPLILVIKENKYNFLNTQSLNNCFCNNNNFGLIKLTNTSPIIDCFKLNIAMHSSLGDNGDKGKGFGFGGWGEDEYRGGKAYIPPKGWFGYGLSVYGRYDKDANGNADNHWLDYEGGKEWCIAYHGAFKNEQTEKLMEEIKNDEDIEHPGNKVGEGILCVYDPKFLDMLAGEITFPYQNQQRTCKIAFMLRVKPGKIRIPKNKQYFWVLNGDQDEVRPYRLLSKPI